MITIGFRASPKAVTFAIYDTEKSLIVNVETIKVPLALDTPEALKYIRNTVLDILREYNVQMGGLRITESAALTTNLERIQFEAVIQEAFASSSLQRYFAGQIANITSRVGIERTDFKKYTAENYAYTRINDWLGYKKEEREAIITALGAINA